MFLAAEGCEGQSQCYGPVAEGSVDPSSFKSMCSFCAEGRDEKSVFHFLSKKFIISQEKEKYVLLVGRKREYI